MPDSISESANDWLRQFLKHFEPNFVDLCRTCSADADDAEIRLATIKAVVQTLLDSGESSDSIAAAIGQVLIERRQGPIAWNSDWNQRRFELIDKEIQGSLTPAEQIELAGLTRTLREQLESEENLPVEGARDLHRKLLELK